MEITSQRRKISCALVIIFLISLILALPRTVNAASSDMVWESVDFAKSVNYRDIAQSDKGLYVVVGDGGAIKTSYDLDTWKSQNSETKTYLFGCAWGNEKFVAVGLNGTIRYSDDGVKWDSTQIDSKIDLYSIVWGKGKFFAVGINGANENRIILSSIDGIEWTSAYESTGDSYWRKIVFINNVYIVLGLSDYAISQDGLKWTKKATKEDIKFNSILWDGNQYVAVGSESSIYVSKDAMEWNPVDNNIYKGLFLSEIAQFNNKYIVIIESGSSCSIVASSDLKVWSMASDRGYGVISKIIKTNDGLVATGWYETILKTKDGIAWSISEKFASNLLKVVWDGKQFLAIGSDGTVHYSKDGQTWDSSVIESDNSVVDVVWTGKEYAALSCTYDTEPDSYDIIKSDVYTSLDGIKWSYVGCINQKNINNLFYFDNRYFALGREGEILVSIDAKNWVAANTTTDNWLSGLAWNGKQFVCVGMFGTIITSTDGVNWAQQDSKCKADLNSVIWNGKRFAVAGDWKAIVSSMDGVKWDFTAGATSNQLENVVWDGEKFLFVENNGEVYTTKDLKNRRLVSSNSLSSPESIVWNGECYVMVGWNGTIAVCSPKSPVKVKINNIPIPLNNAPYIIDGNLMLPAKELAEKMNASYSWNQKTRTIIVTKDNTVMVLKVGSKTATVNSKTVKLECPVTIINDVQMVSAKFLIENIGAKFIWNNDTKTISIVKK